MVFGEIHYYWKGEVAKMVTLPLEFNDTIK